MNLVPKLESIWESIATERSAPPFAKEIETQTNFKFLFMRCLRHQLMLFLMHT